MSEAYARDILRRNVAQICQTIGWNGMNAVPLDILVHVLEKYMQTLGTQANRYAEQFNRTEPNLHDLGLVFRDLHVSLPELTEYVRSVPSVPPPVAVDRFPKPKESNLNFLKPGSHEVVTRPVHVHEHLPPMHPEKEWDPLAVAGTVEIRQNGVDNIETSTAPCTSPEEAIVDSPEKSKDIFKRPPDPVPLTNTKRPRLRLDEEERTREISSVMMTMSGFLSPAREGKLPEARPPTLMAEKHFEKHKVNSHATAVKVPAIDKSDKKSKKSKLVNGKIMKSKRKDKTKGESSKSKDSRATKHPPGYPMKSKDTHVMLHNTVPSGSKVLPPPITPSSSRSDMPPPPSPIHPPVIETKPIIKQEPLDIPSVAPINAVPGEEAIPVPRKIPISKSPLASTSFPSHKQHSSTHLPSEVEIKREVVDDEEKLASQPDRSKINIFKRISNKSKEDKVVELTPEKSQSDTMISRLPTTVNEDVNPNNIGVKSEEPFVNNNDNSAVDLSIDLRTNEVINIDDDSMDTGMMELKPPLVEPQPSISINKSLQVPYSKDLASVSPKTKKEKKHKDKKDKAAKLEAKLLKKQQQRLAYEMAQAEKQSSVKMSGTKPPKASRPKNESKLPQMPPGFPFFPTVPQARGLMPGPGLIPNPGLFPGSDFLAGLTNNPALRGLPPSNLLTNTFGLGTSGPGLIPGPSFLASGLGSSIQSTLMPMGGYPQTSCSSTMKIPPMLRRPSLEVIPVQNDDDRGMHKSPIMQRDKDRHDKHKSQTIPNILQKHKSKSHKDHKSSLYKMPPVQPDITIELNPPKMEPVRQEHPVEFTLPPHLPSPEPAPQPEPQPQHRQLELEPQPQPIKISAPEMPQEMELEITEKKKDKSHKKEKRDKDGLKIKKKKDKKDKNKDKSEKKREKEERQEIKEKIKKERKEKKKEKSAECFVPKLTLKLGSSNSNSPMPPSSPDVFKLNIKPVVKKEEDGGEGLSPMKEEPVSREHSHSPELAQISALVTRPPKPKHSKHNHLGEVEAQSSSPPPSSPSRKNRPPSSHSKYKRILFKPLAKKGQIEDFDEEVATISEEASAPSAPPAVVEKPAGPLPTPYYVDEHGNKIWVCPACGRPDNGSPMIGCDGCDGWYHWICVGITEEPGATEDWFCKSCLAKRAAMALAGVTSGKKRGRKPKGDKTRDCN